MSAEPIHLLIYGTLKNPATFRAVTGWSFDASPTSEPQPTAPRLAAVEATLPDFELVAKDPMFCHLHPSPGATAEGLLLLFNVPTTVLEELVRYEGRRYVQRAVTVQTDAGPVHAVTFVGAGVGRHQSIRPSRRDFKAEALLHERVQRVLAQGAGASADVPGRLRAIAELKGATMDDLLRAQYENPRLSDFFITQALASPLPSMHDLRGDQDAALFAENYLALVVRQSLFNEFEHRVSRQFRHAIEKARTSGRYFPYTVSSLVALQMLNTTPELVSTLAVDALTDLDPRRADLVDFVQWAAVAAEHIFDHVHAQETIDWVLDHRAGGLLPLAAELELSNLPQCGESADAAGFDPEYDSFRYFENYALHRLMWRLGGHVADPYARRPSRKGRFTLSLGAAGRSGRVDPLGQDPWIISQLIEHAVRFYAIQPHALRLSVYVPSRYAPGRGVLPESVTRCLLALAGDAHAGADDRVGIRRVTQNEIVSQVPQRRLDLLSIHAPAALPADVASVTPRRLCRAEYRFARLEAGRDYQPLILAIKGVQLYYRPGPMLESKQMQADPALAQMFDSLVTWASNPTPVSDGQRAEFLSAVCMGLDCELRGRHAHRADYVDEMIRRLERTLVEFNGMVV